MKLKHATPDEQNHGLGIQKKNRIEYKLTTFRRIRVKEAAIQKKEKKYAFQDRGAPLFSGLSQCGGAYDRPQKTDFDQNITATV